MLAEIQGEIKQKQEVKENWSEDKTCKKMIKLDFSFKIAFFGHILKKIQHAHFWVHG